METFKSKLISLKRIVNIDRLLDFIRHGKHARTTHQQGNNDTTSTAPPPSDVSRKEAEMKKQQERAERDREEKQKAIKDKAHHTQAAEAIVQEERATSSKLPVIKGLEKYRLLDKMGEFVIIYLSSFHHIRH